MPHTTDHLLLDDGQCLRVVRRGTQAGGRPVVCLHGWTSTHADWTHWTQALAGAHPSFAWNARAHADVPLTGAPATLERMADDLDALIRHYALERPLLLGHSMGALTIWMHALRHPGTAIGGYGLIDQTPKLVTGAGWRFGIYGDFSAQRNRWFIARQREDFAEAVLELTADGLNARARERYEREPAKFQRSRDWLAGLAHAALTECWCSLAGADLRSALARLHAPVLLVYGDESNFYTAETARWVQAQIPHARLETYAGADHCPHFWQRDRFLGELRALLAACG